MSTVGFRPFVGVFHVYLGTVGVHRWHFSATTTGEGAAGCVGSVCGDPLSVVVAGSFVSGLDKLSGRA